MTQTTRCPRCATTFRVVADQLRISDGWVRCGQCKEVFDATAHLQSRDLPPLLPDLPLDELATPRRGLARVASLEVRGWGEPPAGSAPAPATATEEVPAGAPEATPATAVSRPAPVPPPVPSFLLAASQPGSAPAPEGSALQADAPAPPPLAVGEPGDTALGPQAGFAAAPILGTTLAPETATAEPDPQLPVSGAVPPVPTPATPAGVHPPETADQQGEGPAVQAVADPAPEPLWHGPLAPSESPAIETQPEAVGADADAPPSPAAAVSRPTATEPSGMEPGMDARAADAAPAEPAAEEQPDAPALILPPSDRAGAFTPADADFQESVFEPGTEPGFVLAARRGAFWRRPAVRVVLGLVLLFFVALLAAQIAWRHRDALVARHPALQVVLAPACERMGCRLAAPREPDAIVIDSSSFLRARSDAARHELRFALKNTATHAVAMPLVELTLTDSQDEPLVRRVLRPHEELGAPAQLAPGATWGTSAATQVLDLPTPVAGYRLLAFYP